MDSKPFTEAAALLAAEQSDAVVVGYWTAGDVIIFALDPPTLDDHVLVWRDGEIGWEGVGPLFGDGEGDFGNALDADPTPYADPERLSLIVDALAADEDTPPDVLARAKADLAAAQ